MHSRRLACFVLGLWLGGGLLVAWIATQNFRVVDRLMLQPEPGAALHLKELGSANTRLLFRHQVSEQNRAMFESWEYAQFGLGMLFFFFLLFGTREKKFPLLVVLAMLAVVLLQRVLLTPELVSLGRNIDFVPADVPSPERTRFWVIHSAYSGLEVLKWGAGLALAASFIISTRRGRSDSPGDEFDLIDKPDHRHVNR
jgi:hypothetical protein